MTFRKPHAHPWSHPQSPDHADVLHALAVVFQFWFQILRPYLANRLPVWERGWGAICPSGVPLLMNSIITMCMFGALFGLRQC